MHNNWPDVTIKIMRLSILLLKGLVAVAILSGTPLVAEGLFTYKDQDGRTHYVDRLDAVPEEYRDSIKNRKDLPEITKVPSKKLHGSYGVPKKRVQILVTTWCGYCRKLEGFLQDKGIQYQKFDIEKSTQGRKLYSKHGSGGVPLTIIDKKTTVRGYNPAAIMRALKSKKPGAGMT